MARTLQTGLIVLACAIGIGSATAQDATGTLALQDYQGVPYLTGGIGENERASILAAADRFNLKLTLAEKGGAYLAGVRVIVVDAGGATVLDVRSEGPLVLALLPRGNYRVSAEMDGQRQTRSIDIPARGQRSLVFYW
ncbi:MAG TPA: carboxypeptidase regulatory-like domain-containing protein [Rhodocyclaceae bacterium]|nr:carboxypeptidase regulatory-like domain-containing protein [Rhodocyclaceae bacterium]